MNRAHYRIHSIDSREKLHSEISLCHARSRSLRSAVVRIRPGWRWVAWEGGVVMPQEVTESRLRCVLPFEAVPMEVPLLRRAAVQQLDRWGVLTASGEAEADAA